MKIDYLLHQGGMFALALVLIAGCGGAEAENGSRHSRICGAARSAMRWLCKSPGQRPDGRGCQALRSGAARVRQDGSRLGAPSAPTVMCSANRAGDQPEWKTTANWRPLALTQCAGDFWPCRSS